MIGAAAWEDSYVDETSGIKVDYRFRPAKDDRNHLIVVLSGIRRKVHTLDFVRSASSLRANVLWIYDDFHGMPGYYYWGRCLQDLSSAVHNTITWWASNLGLSKRQITLFGLSKGANAALLFAAEYDYPNVIASAPRAFNGTAIRKNYPKIFSNIAGADLDPDYVQRTLDEALFSKVRNDANVGKTIIVATSPADVDRYYTESAVLTRLLAKYVGFQLIHTRSPLVQDHLSVTKYNMPLYISLLTQFSEGFTPRMSGAAVADAEFLGRNGSLEKAIGNGSINNAPDISQVMVQGPPSMRNQLRSEVSSVDLKDDGSLHFDGYAVMPGTPRADTDSGRSYVRLHGRGSGRNVFKYPLRRKDDKSLNVKLYDGLGIDYSYGGVNVESRKGIPLAELPIGNYAVVFEVSQNGTTCIGESIAVPAHKAWVAVEGKLIGSYAARGEWHICVRSPVGRRISDCYFDLVKCSVEEGHLFVEGFFIPYGSDFSRWDSIRYYLIFRDVNDPDESDDCKVFPLANGNRPKASARSKEIWRDQSKAYFATKKYQGVNLEELPCGTFKIMVSGRIGDDVFTRGLDLSLKVGDREGVRFYEIQPRA